jgi:hypothetical protein
LLAAKSVAHPSMADNSTQPTIKELAGLVPLQFTYPAYLPPPQITSLGDTQFQTHRSKLTADSINKILINKVEFNYCRLKRMANTVQGINKAKPISSFSKWLS